MLSALTCKTQVLICKTYILTIIMAFYCVCNNKVNHSISVINPRHAKPRSHSQSCGDFDDGSSTLWKRGLLRFLATLVLRDALAFFLAFDVLFGLGFADALHLFRDAALGLGFAIGLGLLEASTWRVLLGLDWGSAAQAKACASI